MKARPIDWYHSLVFTPLFHGWTIHWNGCASESAGLNKDRSNDSDQTGSGPIILVSKSQTNEWLRWYVLVEVTTASLNFFFFSGQISLDDFKRMYNIGTHLILTDDDTPGCLYLCLQLQVFLGLQAKVLPLGGNLSLKLSCNSLSGQAYGLQCTCTLQYIFLDGFDQPFRSIGIR